MRIQLLFWSLNYLYSFLRFVLLFKNIYFRSFVIAFSNSMEKTCLLLCSQLFFIFFFFPFFFFSFFTQFDNNCIQASVDRSEHINTINSFVIFLVNSFYLLQALQVLHNVFISVAVHFPLPISKVHSKYNMQYVTSGKI